MPDNFFVTAERMHDSSKLLHEETHYHNACYTAGYVAECYLKILVLQMSMPRPLFGRSGYGHDVSLLNSEILSYISSNSAVSPFSRYSLDMGVSCPSIYTSWNPLKRYDDTSGWDNDLVSNNFQHEQGICFEKIISMYVDGLIS